MNAVKLALGVVLLAGCGATKPAPALAPANATSTPAPEIAAPQADDVDMTYTAKETAAAGHDAPLTSIHPKDAAAQAAKSP